MNFSIHFSLSSPWHRILKGRQSLFTLKQRFEENKIKLLSRFYQYIREQSWVNFLLGSDETKKSLHKIKTIALNIKHIRSGYVKFKNQWWPGTVAHTCNPNALGG